METGARDRLDAAILCSLGERRAYREHRVSPSLVWDRLEASVTAAATALWETPDVAATADLLSFCVYVARELAFTASLDLDPIAEWRRLQAFAPRAIVTLDEIGVALADASADDDPVYRTLARAFGRMRAELAIATQSAWPTAA